MHCVTAKFVPKIKTADQKQQHVNICKELRHIASDDVTFLSRVITDDESWFTVMTLRQSKNPPNGKVQTH
jgi:hypothetical protein